MPMAVPRVCVGNRSEMMECDGGVEPASPTPTPIRARASCRKLAAYPQATVMALQMVMAAVTMFRRWLRSANIAMGMPRVA